MNTSSSSSLKTKFLFVSIIVGVIVAVVLSTIMYLTTVKPVPDQIKHRMIGEMEDFINGQIDLKIQGGIIGSTSQTLQKGLIPGLEVEDREELMPFFSGIRDGFRSKTNFKNIAMQLITADGRSLIKTWDHNSYGQDLSNSPLVKQAMEQKQAFGALGIGDRGVGVVAISPIVFDEELMGMIAFVQGLASVNKAFKKEKNGDWLLLVDRRYVKEKYGSMPVIEGNQPFGENYLLANNRWFNEQVVADAQKTFVANDGDQKVVYTVGDKVVIDIPALDAENLVFGRHLFILDGQVYHQPIEEAMNTAWMSLAGVIIGIALLTLALVIAVSRMVITPLARVQKTAEGIIESGDFSVRTEVKGNDEVARTGHAINQLLENVAEALGEANQTVSALAEGDFSKRINGDYKGDLDALKRGVNESAVNLVSVMEALGSVMTAMKEGRFDIDVDVDAKGAYRTMMLDAQSAMQEVNAIIVNINEVMGNMQMGQFHSRVNADAKGQLAVLKQRINDSMSDLDQAMSDITKVVVAQSEGDLTQTITGDFQGDLDKLKVAVNSSLSRLGDVVAQAIESANIVDNAANEVAKGALDLSSRVQQQAASVEETSATMEEMNSAVQNNTQNSMEVANQIETIQGESVQASEVMSKTIEAMNEIQSSSHQIAEIVNIIDGIAFQTNLLALNAAVEAARAGENGRGFAVVAGEVRALAQKSADAAKDIKALIERSVKSIDEGTNLASESGDVITGITTSIDEITKMINHIAKASAEQAEGVDQVYKAIHSIDGATQQSAALVEETSAAAESMTEQANQLSQNMAFFKINRLALKPANPEATAPQKPAAIEAPKKAIATKPAAEKPESKPAAAPKKPSALPPASDGDEWEDF